MSADKTGKRDNYLEWDQYFMGIALLSAERSKDPSTQVGACIVNTANQIVGVGYNGFPRGISDEALPWEREGEPLDTKYPYVVHAEVNAVLNSLQSNLDGCRLYVALFPCNECAKVIIQAGVREIIYLADKYAETDAVRASKRLLDLAGVAYRRLDAPARTITLTLSSDQ